MPLSLAVDGSSQGMRPLEHIRLATGHKVQAWRRDASVVSGLVITPPKYRRRKEPVETTCPECLHTYFKGDPESSALHRKEHKERMRYLDLQLGVQPTYVKKPGIKSKACGNTWLPFFSPNR